MLLVVNFHYIRPEGQYPYPGIFPTPAEKLQAQLEVLGRSFDFVSGDDLLGALTDDQILPDRACLITFDDGLREQYEVAAPILEALGVRGVFFVCTQPVHEGVGLVVHKMHRMRATRTPEAFLQQAITTARKLGVKLDLVQVDDKKANRQYLYDDLPTKRLKYLFNHVLPFEAFSRLVTAMFREEMAEREFCHEMYMSNEQIHALGSRHTVGSHSHFHGPLAALPREELQANLKRSRAILHEITAEDIHFVSYPYGGPTAVSRVVGQSAASAGFLAGFTMERSLNQTLSEPHLLARVSTNDAPGGKAPLMVQLDGDGSFELRAPMTRYRRIYFDEENLGATASDADGKERLS